MFSLTSPNVTQAQLRNSIARLSRRASHWVKIIGAAAIALLAAGNNLPQEQHACAVVLSLDPSGRRYDACMRSLDTLAASAIQSADAAESVNKSAWEQDSLA